MIGNERAKPAGGSALVFYVCVLLKGLGLVAVAVIDALA
jgi:hypothetical protein